jgi:cell division protein FtsZ
MGVGAATGKDKAEQAAKAAISSPLLESSIRGSHGILIRFVVSPDVGLEDAELAATLIQNEAHPDANIIWGAAFDPTLQDEMRVTVIATGFIAENSDKKPEPSRVVPAPSIENIVAQPTVTPVPSFEQQFNRVEIEQPVVAEPVKVAPQPVNTSSYEDVYGSAFVSIKSKRR